MVIFLSVMMIFLSVMVIFRCVVFIVAASPCARHQKVTVLLLFEWLLSNQTQYAA